MRQHGTPWYASVIVVVGLIAGAIWLLNQAPSCESSEPKKRPATIDKNPSMQAERKALINELIGRGIFTKVERGASIPKIWVTRQFMALPFKDKEGFVSVVYAYYFDGSEEHAQVQIKDALSGKVLGNYAVWQGGLKMH